MIGTPGAKDIDKKDPDVTEGLKEVHIGMFFDGTANNMVQKALFDTFLNVSGNARNTGLFPEEQQIYAEKEQNPILPSSIKQKTQTLQERNMHFEVEEKSLFEDTVKGGMDAGYSNVAVLYSLFDIEKLKNREKATAHKFYIEGSGATDISHATKMNINGLGFGLGDAGVTALVSKGIKAVTDYLNSISPFLNNETEIKFYVFGFSRGAACARLFTTLVTRGGNGEALGRENEFSQHLPKGYMDGGLWKPKRVTFLDPEKKSSFKCKNVSADKITVEYLGIYDTVVSIGLLKQKNGWTDPAGLVYKKMPNYNGNWHYMNVHDYGMYTSKDTRKLKKVCHIGALDEYRENFAFTNIGETVPGNAIEIMMPGCHSDVGGGYVDGTDQEMVLDKFEDKTVEKGKNGKNTSLIIKDVTRKPTAVGKNDDSNIGSYDAYEMSLPALKELGWIDYTIGADGKIVSAKPGSAGGYTVQCHEDEVNLYFKRYVKRGWSDVSLAMMMANCKASQCDIFKPTEFYKYEDTLTDPTARAMGRKAVGTADTGATGRRIWLIPDGRYNSPKYRDLRKNYIHFTSTSQLAHVRNKGIEGSGANFGNKPNYDTEATLCRITYFGDKGAKGAQDYVSAVNYLYDTPGIELQTI